MNLFVANISHVVNETALRALFEQFGSVKSVRIMTDRNTGTSRGFGFVEMSREDEGREAIRRLGNAEFFGRRLMVSKAHRSS